MADNDNLPRKKSVRTRQKASAQIVGVAGKTYGLQLPQNSAPSTERLHIFDNEVTEDSKDDLFPSAPSAKPIRSYNGVEEDDLNKEREISGVGAVISGKDEKHLAAWSMSMAAAANAEKLRQESKATQEKILAEDPSVYEYDSIYDELHKGRAQEEKLKMVDNTQRLPKYMLCMQQKAERRKHFLDAAYVKKLQREAERGKAIYGDKDVFVTESYKRKLMESKLWEDEDNAGVDEGGNVNNNEFYSNLIKESVDARKALGAELNEDSLLLKRLQEKKIQQQQQGVSSSSSPPIKKHKEDSSVHTFSSSSSSSSSSKTRDDYNVDSERKETEEEIERRERREEAERVAARRREVEKGFFEAQKAQKVEAARQKAEYEARLARRNTQDSIKSAREKYLERKNKLAAELKAAREKANENE